MNFRHIEVFRAIMLTGTASRAAEVLMLTQPAVSRALGELERDIGITLFNRVRSRLVATPEAQLLLRDVEAAFWGIDRLRTSAARIRDMGSGQLRIASLSSLGAVLVPKAIGLFTKRHEGVSVTLHVRTSSVVRDLVASGQFDIGLAADEIDLSGVVHQVFSTPRLVCALPPGHPLCARETIHVRDLHDQRFIAFSPEDTVQRTLNGLLAKNRCQPKIVVETLFSATVQTLVANGVGIGLVNPYTLEDRDASRLVIRNFEPGIFARTLLIYPPDRQRSRLVSEMIDVLTECRNTPLNNSPATRKSSRRAE